MSDWDDEMRERERPLSDLSDEELLRTGRRLAALGVHSGSEAARLAIEEAIRRGLVPGVRPKVRVTVVDHGRALPADAPLASDPEPG